MSRRRPSRRSRRDTGRQAEGPVGGQVGGRVSDGLASTESWGGADWSVRRVTGSAATKPYRCPGCDQLIAIATPHVVVWPDAPAIFASSGLEERRHWHSACWSARERRPPVA